MGSAHEAEKEVGVGVRHMNDQDWKDPRVGAVATSLDRLFQLVRMLGKTESFCLSVWQWGTE